MIKSVIVNIRQLQFRYTGVQSYIYNLVLALVKHYPKIHFDLATLNYKGNNQFIEHLKQHQNVSILNTSGSKKLFSEIYFDHVQVSRLIKNQDIYFSPVNITPLFKKPGVKYVVGVLDLCTFIVPKTTTFQLKTYYNLFLPSSLSRADKIISISKSTKTDLVNLFKIPDQKISVVYLGVDSEVVVSRVPKKINTGKFFLTMATSPRKNVLTVIRAFSVFSKKVPSMHYKIVVNNPILSLEIKKFIRDIGISNKKVQVMANYISKQRLSNLYSRATAFVYCPIYEGFGLPVLEAMSRSCPVITSTTSSLPEVAGGAAITVNPHNYLDIAAAMSKLYTKNSLRIKMIKGGLINSKKYNWEKSAIKTMRIFSGL